MIIKGKLNVKGRSNLANGDSVCIVSSYSHNTNSVPAQFGVDINTLAQRYGYRPGTTWYVQYGRWTFPQTNPDIREFQTEAGQATYFLGGTQVHDQGYYDPTNFVGSLNGTPRAVGFISGIVDSPDTDSANVSTTANTILMVASTLGAPNDGFQVQYANQSQPHPAVEFFFNGAWKNGHPVDGACKPVALANIAQIAITFPGGVVYDETGGMGSTGETTSTVTTRGSLPSGTPAYPALLSTATGLTQASSLTDLGYTADDVTNQIDVAFGIYDGSTTYRVNDVSLSDGETVGDFLYAFNRLSDNGFYATITPEGRVVIANVKPGVTTANAFDFTNATGLNPFGFSDGTAPVSTLSVWQTVSSTNLFTLSTPLAQFAPKGVFYVALEQGGEYGQDPIQVGVIIGEGATFTGEANILHTVGDLIDNINSTMNATAQNSYAYLENGRLVVALLDPMRGDAYNFGNAETILMGRYENEPLDQDNKVVWREPVELLFGASDYRFNTGFRYNDQAVGIARGNALTNLIFSGSTVPAQTSTPAFPAVRYNLGSRMLSKSKLLSQIYPAGYILRRHDVQYDNYYQLCNMQISETSTLEDLFNYVVDGGLTLRLVDGNGNHVADNGVLRLTAGDLDGATEILWYDPATGNYGSADRLFVTDPSADGTVPTNITGTIAS